MRRSVRRPARVTHKVESSRAISPSSTEDTLAATPSVSPSPDGPSIRHALPGMRDDCTPKRPMNAFILFSNEKRSELADRNPDLSNAAVSVLLGQSWREMHSSEKAAYVNAARKIKEEFALLHPEARTRGIRKGKRKHAEGGSRTARGIAPPSLHALALVGARLNQGFEEEGYNDDDELASASPSPASCEPPSLLDQLCTVAENEHTAAAHMLSALSAF